jgi:pyruvate dehydrogenase E2 component (dihydrolipoamide acetyltransferase)
MSFELVLPDIGEGVVEAEVQRWLVKPGDEVAEDQPLVEVMTDKATVTIPSPRRGRVTRLCYEEGQLARVHTALLELELEPAPPEERAPAHEGPAALAARGARPKAMATPAVRALARHLGLELERVRGTGPNGRVTKQDLEQARNGHGRHEGPAPAPQRPAPFADALPRGEPEAGPADEIVPVRGIRRLVAERMALSRRHAAHFTFVEQVDVTELLRVKERIAAAAREEGVKVTLLPFVVKAAVVALKKFPYLNATLDEERGEIHLKRAWHVGVASATEQGLVVPVVRHADRRSLLDLAREIERLATASKEGRLRHEDVGGSTFTVTSLGAMGGLFATPIINYPEVAILGVHRIRPTPVVKDGQVVVREVMHLSLSFDHRVVDGHVGAAFAYALIRDLEDPSLLFMNLA